MNYLSLCFAEGYKYYEKYKVLFFDSGLKFHLNEVPPSPFLRKILYWKGKKKKGFLLPLIHFKFVFK